MVIYIPLSKTGKNKGKYEAIISDEDSILAEFDWSALISRKTIYALRNVTKDKKDYLHRIVLSRKLARPLLKGEEVDHINGNGLDNRRENLRVATRSQNAANTKKPKHSNREYKGVEKTLLGYTAIIKDNKKVIRIGTYKTAEEARQAYCAKAQELYGEFANDGENPIGNKPIEMPKQRPLLDLIRANNQSGYRWIQRVENGYVVRIRFQGKSYYFGFRPTIDESITLLISAIDKLEKGEI